MRIDTVLPSGINSIMRSQPSPPFPCQPPTACGLNMTIGIFAPFAFCIRPSPPFLTDPPNARRRRALCRPNRAQVSPSRPPPSCGAGACRVPSPLSPPNLFSRAIRNGSGDRLMPFKLLALQQVFGPFQSFVARRKFKRHYEDFTPIPVEKFKRRIFEGHFALGVREGRYEAVPPKRIFETGK